MTPRFGRRSRVAAIVLASLGELLEARADDLGDVRALVDQGDYASAEARARESLAGLDPCSPARPALEALLGEAARRGAGRRSPETLEVAEHALALAEELFGAADHRTAEPRLQLGLLRSVRGEWEGGKRDLERAHEQFREARDPRQALALANLAIAVHKLAPDAARAFEMLDEAESVLDRLAPGDSLDRAWVLDMRANVLASLRRHGEARTVCERSLAMRRRWQRADHPMLANTLMSLGKTQDAEGRLSEARASYEEILTIPPWSPAAAGLLAEIRGRLGTILLTLGDPVRAKASYQQALADLETVGQESTPAYARVLLDLGRIARDASDDAEAGRLIERCLATLDRAEGGAEARCEAHLLAANLALRSDDLERASASLAEARASSDPEVMNRCDEVDAWIALGRGEPGRAEELLGDVLRRIAEPGSGSGSGLPQLLRDRARMRLYRGDLAGALEDSLAAERSLQELWEVSVLGLEEISAIGFEDSVFVRGTLQPGTCAAEGLQDPAAAERVWNALLASQDRVFRECSERLELARAAKSTDLAQAGARLAEARVKLAGLHVRGQRGGGGPELAAAIEAAREEREDAERDLAERMRREPRIVRSDPEVAALRGVLPPGVVLLRYCRSERPPPKDDSPRDPFAWESTFSALVLEGGEGAPRIVDLGRAREIEALVDELRRAIRYGASRSEYASIASALRRRILDPALALVPDARLVHVLPAETIALVPFPALCSDSGDFLVETGPTFHVLGSEADLLRNDPDAPTGTGLLALGDPRATGWPALPHTHDEIASVAASFERGRTGGEGSVLLEGARASEDEMRRRSGGRRVIHLATHGYFEDGRGAEAVAPSRGASPGLPRESLELVRSSSPFLRSGLVFTDESSRELAGRNDGILTAEEVMGLDLTGVEWVVLSACNTGIGEIRRTEGVLGLVRAFRMAGARTVIASLWPVEDRWAREWMEALYHARFEHELSTPEAVRAASLAVLADLGDEEGGPLPRRWASFIALGKGW